MNCSTPGLPVHHQLLEFTQTHAYIWNFRKMVMITLYAAAKSLQSCLTLCDLIDDSPPGAPIPGILQARTLEWVAISFSNS